MWMENGPDSEIIKFSKIKKKKKRAQLSFCSLLFEATLCRISVTFIDKDGEEKHIKVPVGMSMLEAAHENDIELEGKSFDFRILLFCLKILVF